MIKIYAVELVDAVTKESQAKLYFGRHAQANRYAHNKSKASGGAIIGRVFKVEAKVIDESLISFTLLNSNNSLYKET